MPEFEFTEILPLGKDDTPYRLVTTDGVSTFDTPEGRFLKVSPEALTRITEEAMRDIAHFLRPGHLQQLRNIQIQHVDDDAILAFSKYLPGSQTDSGKADCVIVVINTDPHAVRESTIRLNMELFGLPNGTQFDVTELITGTQYTWGNDNFIRLDSFTEPAHIFAVTYPKGHTS